MILNTAKLSPAKWTKAVFHRSMWDGENPPRNVSTSGHICGCWGLSKNDPKDNYDMPWMITHIPTGLGVCTIPTLGEGKQFCQVLNTALGWEHMTRSEDMTPEQTAAYHAARFD